MIRCLFSVGVAFVAVLSMASLGLPATMRASARSATPSTDV